MKKHHISAMVMLLLIGSPYAFSQEQTECFESRKGASELAKKEVSSGLPNVKCSTKTGAVLWWGDPYDGTEPMGEMPIEADYSKGEAVIKSRDSKLIMLPVCGIACHNGTFPPKNDDRNPRMLTFHQDIIPDSLNLQHGRGGIWCMDCHHTDTRNKLVDNFDNEVNFNQSQKVCGKCHGSVYRDWRDGVHGKRIGQWASTGKKRWFICTECHNPHDVQQGTRNSGFVQLEPEPAPNLPRGLYNKDHERLHGHAAEKTSDHAEANADHQ